MKEVVLKTNNLTKQYNKNVVLDNVNITIKKGDIYGLIGRNGAGKTTLMKIITTLASPTSGTFELFNTSSENDELFDNKKRVGSLIEYPAFYPNLSAYDNLKYYTIQRGIVDKNQINKVLELVNLTGTGKKKVKTFSLGMKQRLGIALAILNSPEIVILDEPFSGLDPVNSKILQDVVTELIEEGRIVIFSSHQMSYVEEFCEDIAIINNGEIALSGDIADIKAEYGKNQLIISAVGMGAEELAEKLKTSCEDTLSVTGIHKDGVIVKNIHELSGNALIKEIMNADIEIASFDSYRPSLNDIFVKAVGGDR